MTHFPLLSQNEAGRLHKAATLRTEQLRAVWRRTRGAAYPCDPTTILQNVARKHFGTPEILRLQPEQVEAALQHVRQYRPEDYEQTT